MLRTICGGLMEIAMHCEEQINFLANSTGGPQTLQAVSPALQVTVKIIAGADLL